MGVDVGVSLMLVLVLVPLYVTVPDAAAVTATEVVDNALATLFSNGQPTTFRKNASERAPDSSARRLGKRVNPCAPPG